MKADLKLILFGLALAFMSLFLWECQKNSDMKAELARQDQNSRALLDTVKETRNRAGELQSEKLTLIATSDELKKFNAGLYEEMKKQRGVVLQLTAATGSIQQELKGIKTVLENDTSVKPLPGEKWPKAYRLTWKKDTVYSPGNYHKISGFSRLRVLNDSTFVPGLTDITENESGFKLITGLKKEGSDYKIFVKSDHPGFKVSDIEGAVIPSKGNPLFPQKRNWGLGITFGPTLSVGGSVTMPAPFIGLGVCFGLQYNIKEF